METKNIMIVGVGGQGTLLTSRILGKLMIGAGYDVKLSEVHGMAQRGGSVVTFVRYGDKVYEPIVEEGTADLLIAFERLEAKRYEHFLKKDGVLVLNDVRIDPMPVVTGAATYPEGLLEKLNKKHKVYSIDANAEADAKATATARARIVEALIKPVSPSALRIISHADSPYGLRHQVGCLPMKATIFRNGSYPRRPDHPLQPFRGNLLVAVFRHVGEVLGYAIAVGAARGDIVAGLRQS